MSETPKATTLSRVEPSPKAAPDPGPAPKAEEIESAGAALRAICARLPECEERANAMAHITTALRWAALAPKH